MKPNSKGSLNNAHKLSCISLESEITHNGIKSIMIGCDDDDTFYDDGEGRLKIYIEKKITKEDIKGFDYAFLMMELDLEQLIKTAKKLCPQLF